jgi:hypothetical protein
MRRPTEQDVCPRCKRRGGLHLVAVGPEITVYCDACGWEIDATDLPPIRRVYGAEGRPKVRDTRHCYTNHSPE